ncbi:hypothetical protein BDW59DRAFT_90203 [Aspergillus cavernicola]|uniref:Uncharacterized protein n=1 Tax=Aspergillus cavernicola TaxID=176166 RepID=A0ABR4I9U6_9EURO
MAFRLHIVELPHCPIYFIAKRTDLRIFKASSSSRCAASESGDSSRCWKTHMSLGYPAHAAQLSMLSYILDSIFRGGLLFSDQSPRIGHPPLVFQAVYRKRRKQIYHSLEIVGKEPLHNTDLLESKYNVQYTDTWTVSTAYHISFPRVAQRA